MAKFQGQLTFDVNSGKFWITDPADESPVTSLEFGDSFEAKVEDKWVPTSIQIDNDLWGNLVFKLKDTPYSGHLDGIEVRQ